MGSLTGRYLFLSEGSGEGVGEMWLRVVQSKSSLETKFRFIPFLLEFRAFKGAVYGIIFSEITEASITFKPTITLAA